MDDITGKSKWKGDKSEITVAYKLTMLNIGVSIPFGDNLSYDLIMDINNRLYKVQAKTGSLKNNNETIVAKISKSIIGKDKKYKNVKYTSKEVDFYAINCIETNETALIPFNEVEDSRSVTIRRIKSKYQTENIRLLENYLLENKINEMLEDTNPSIISSNENLDLDSKLIQAKKRISSSGYRGVAKSTKHNFLWESYIHFHKKRIFIGRDNDARELAKLYDMKAIELHGEDAVTNLKLGLL